MKSLTELKFMNRAIKQRWNLTDHQRSKALNRLEEFVDGEDPKLALFAINTLTKIDALNLRETHLEILRQPKHLVHHEGLSTDELIIQIREKAKQLGLDGDKMIESMNGKY